MIFTLLSLPMDGIKFIFNTIAKVAEEQYTDDAPLKEQLLELQVKLESGDITEDQYVEEEARILRDLRNIQNYKREKAGLPPEDGTGLSGTVQEGSGVSLTWDAESNENAGYAASKIERPVEGTSVPDLANAEPEVEAPKKAAKARTKKGKR
jgi:Gas vesicle protein G